MERSRPAVAGTFYPGDPRQLAAEVEELLDSVEQFEPAWAPERR
jgi:AmmeMemoRadiSam system protein B